MPACFTDVMTFVLKLAQFELVPEDFSEAVFEPIVNPNEMLSMDDVPFNANMEQFDEESTYMIHLMFVQFGILLLCSLEWIAVFLSRYFCYDKKKYPRIAKWVDNKMPDRYSFFFRIFIELALDITISFLIEYARHPMVKTPQQMASRVIAYVALVIVFAQLVLGFVVIKFYPKEVEEEEEGFTEKFGVLWEDQKKARTSGPVTRKPWFQVFFIVRRCLFAIILVVPQFYLGTHCIQFDEPMTYKEMQDYAFSRPTGRLATAQEIVDMLDARYHEFGVFPGSSGWCAVVNEEASEDDPEYEDYIKISQKTSEKGTIGTSYFATHNNTAAGPEFESTSLCYYYDQYTTKIILQIMAVIALNLASGLYIANAAPFVSKQANMVELLNEFMGLTMSCSLMQFLNTISSGLVYTMGMMGNLWIISMIGVNCLVIVMNTINECRHRRRLKSIKAAN